MNEKDIEIDRLRQRLEEANINAAELGRALGVSNTRLALALQTAELRLQESKRLALLVVAFTRATVASKEYELRAKMLELAGKLL